MPEERRNALERMIETFNMTSNLPEDLDIDSPPVQALLATLDEAQRNNFLAMAKDPGVRKMSVSSNAAMGRYWDEVLNARDRGKKVAFIPFNCSPEIFHALDIVPVGVEVRTLNHGAELFDAVFIATHSDQALRLLADPTPAERAVLGQLRYQRNEAVLHTDASVMPRSRRAWASWNYHLQPDNERVALTYDMNRLQGLDAPVNFLVTLNNTDAIDPRKIIRRMVYEHPVFTPGSVAAQARRGEISGGNRTYYCGAYWRNGFHEDGVVSSLDAVTHFQERLAHGQLHLRRAS